MNSSYMDRFLVIDLTRKSHHSLPVPEWLKTEFIGGKGFGAKLLMDLQPKEIDALAPESILMFMTGPLTATAAPSMRACVTCKSPLTNGYLDSFFGGHFGPEIKFAGYDGLIIHGRSESPVYLFIDDDTVEFRNAAHLRGKDTLESNRLIKREIEDESVRVVTIGPAGENQVRFALISCEFNRQAGRGGAGAVMGSKHLKGIAIRGNKRVGIAAPDKFKQLVTDAEKQISQSPECQALTIAGTSTAVEWSNDIGTLPVNNFTLQHHPDASKIGGVGQQRHLFLGKSACFGCPIRCAQMGAVRTGRHKHIITDTIEYETAAMLGSNLGIHDIRALAYLAKKCDTLGVDTISMGNVIGFAFEALKNGLIPPPDNMPLEFGNVENAGMLIDAICLRKGSLGRLLGQGVKKASKQIGRGAEHFALHVRGMEIPGWAVRGTPVMGLAYMTADRGACHQRAFMTAYDAGDKLIEGRPVSSLTTYQKAEILKNEQDYIAGTDTLVKCDFAAAAITEKTYLKLLESATGMALNPNLFHHVGERIWNITRCFNLREGLSFKDECLPGRFTEKPLTSGPLKGKRLKVRDMKQLRSDYYSARGWDNQGTPEAHTLNRLGISSGSRQIPPDRLQKF